MRCNSSKVKLRKHENYEICNIHNRVFGNGTPMEQNMTQNYFQFKSEYFSFI